MAGISDFIGLAGGLGGGTSGLGMLSGSGMGLPGGGQGGRGRRSGGEVSGGNEITPEGLASGEGSRGFNFAFAAKGATTRTTETNRKSINQGGLPGLFGIGAEEFAESVAPKLYVAIAILIVLGGLWFVFRNK